jgi:hypothetical protein
MQALLRRHAEQVREQLRSLIEVVGAQACNAAGVAVILHAVLEGTLKTPENRVGRAGIEPATLGLKVRMNKLRGAARKRNAL